VWTAAKFSTMSTNIKTAGPKIAGVSSGKVTVVVARLVLAPCTSAASSISGFTSSRAL
jgi:hypothetical protein